jgi:alpha-tubulin suppressor-like RCC1 family protein
VILPLWAESVCRDLFNNEEYVMGKKSSFVKLVGGFVLVLSAAAWAGSIQGWGGDDLLDQIPVGTDFIAIAAGEDHAVALRANGSIVGWGTNESGQIDLPDSNDFDGISAGYGFTLALGKDGSIDGWGNDDYGQISNIPEGTDFVEVAAGGYHGLARRVDGSIEGWGWNVSGQINVPTGPEFVEIAAGGFHSMALRYDGTVACWGNDAWGQATDPEGLFTDISAGYGHSLGLNENGTLLGWGNDDYEQITVPDGNDFVAVAAGYDHSLAIKLDGSIVGWGANESGQADAPQGLFAAAAGGGTYSLGLAQLGSITLLSPNGGEEYHTGDIVTVEWEWEGPIYDVWLEYSIDGGANWVEMSPANEGNTGSYLWVAPIATSQSCLARVKSNPSLAVSDMSCVP